MVEGTQLHWAELGERNGAPPLLLLHGLYDSHRTWKLVAGHLAADRLVLMPDLPGHGLSDRPDASYAVEWYGRMIVGLVACLGLGVLDVLGHSFGGAVAQMQLLRAPWSTRRLVLAASGALPFLGLGAHLALRGQEGLTREHCEELARMNAAEGTARAFSRTLGQLSEGRRHPRAGFLARVGELPAIPEVAVLWGTRDKVVPIAHGRALSAALVGADFLPFEGCGHHVHHEQPEAFASAVLAYLDSPSPSLARAS